VTSAEQVQHKPSHHRRGDLVASTATSVATVTLINAIRSSFIRHDMTWYSSCLQVCEGCKCITKMGAQKW
jgi:hypothetical protein